MSNVLWGKRSIFTGKKRREKCSREKPLPRLRLRATVGHDSPTALPIHRRDDSRIARRASPSGGVSAKHQRKSGRAMLVPTVAAKTLPAVGTTIGRPPVSHQRGTAKSKGFTSVSELATSSLRAGLRGGEKHFGLTRILWQRSEWRDLLAFGFPLRGTGKPNKGIHQYAHWFMYMPPACTILIRFP